MLHFEHQLIASESDLFHLLIWADLGSSPSASLSLVLPIRVVLSELSLIPSERLAISTGFDGLLRALSVLESHLDRLVVEQRSQEIALTLGQVPLILDR